MAYHMFAECGHAVCGILYASTFSSALPLQPFCFSNCCSDSMLLVAALTCEPKSAWKQTDVSSWDCCQCFNSRFAMLPWCVLFCRLTVLPSEAHPFPDSCWPCLPSALTGNPATPILVEHYLSSCSTTSWRLPTTTSLTTTCSLSKAAVLFLLHAPDQ